MWPFETISGNYLCFSSLTLFSSEQLFNVFLKRVFFKQQK